MAVRNRLSELMEEKSKRDGKTIRAADVARAVKQTRQNISKWVKNDVLSYDSETIAAFCRYFDCTVGELIVRDDKPQPAPEDTPKE